MLYPKKISDKDLQQSQVFCWRYFNNCWTNVASWGNSSTFQQVPTRLWKLHWCHGEVGGQGPAPAFSQGNGQLCQLPNFCFFWEAFFRRRRRAVCRICLSSLWSLEPTSCGSYWGLEDQQQVDPILLTPAMNFFSGFAPKLGYQDVPRCYFDLTSMNWTLDPSTWGVASGLPFWLSHAVGADLKRTVQETSKKTIQSRCWGRLNSLSGGRASGRPVYIHGIWMFSKSRYQSSVCRRHLILFTFFYIFSHKKSRSFARSKSWADRHNVSAASANQLGAIKKGTGSHVAPLRKRFEK